MTASKSSSIRSARLGLRATPEQEAVLRRAAGVGERFAAGRRGILFLPAIASYRGSGFEGQCLLVV